MNKPPRENHSIPSSETQGQIKGARESLNGRKNIYGTKKSKERREEALGTMYTRPVPNGRRFSGSWLVPENLCFSCTNQKPEWRRPFGTGLVRYCSRGLFSPFFTFLRAKFFRPFRLSLVPTICPWVSEDDSIRAPLISVCFVIREDNSQKCRRCFCFTTELTSSHDYSCCGFGSLTLKDWQQYIEMLLF